ncbi:XRE family transcriptional regulator [Microbacterium protaetiae]|uniref:XRE family transcriptional regulator n=1 Tax=Microbacterium protaetiae TaxID=2509458 RepID=A0A4P6ED27_9MICO|nr:helix-turn-helix transcriptional regulator [Microbacterium protaetiae]QAY59263.1 XRE family transcriptional regulator [Microbacterium protaetiae]
MPRVPSAAAAHIGTQIVRARQGRKMTQDQLAAATGIDSSNIRSYEGGRATPSIHSLVRIAVALDVEPGSLIEGLTLAHFAPTTRSRRAS